MKLYNIKNDEFGSAIVDADLVTRYYKTYFKHRLQFYFCCHKTDLPKKLPLFIWKRSDFLSNKDSRFYFSKRIFERTITLVIRYRHKKTIKQKNVE